MKVIAAAAIWFLALLRQEICCSSLVTPFSISLVSVPLTFFIVLIFQVSTPVELPAVTLIPKQETPKTPKFTPPPTTFKSLSTTQTPIAAAMVSDSQGSCVAAETAADDGDEELDQLLGLQKPVSGAADQSVSGACKEGAPSEKGM